MTNEAALAAQIPNLSLRHLQAELARIDVLISREVARWQMAGQNPGDRFRGLHISDEEAGALAGRPLGASWGQTAPLSAADTASLAQAEAEAQARAAGIATAARWQGEALRLEVLAAAFGLDRFDVDTLLVCLAPALDLRYERLYAYLQDDVTRRNPTPNLILDLLAPAEAERRLPLILRFGDDAPLFRYALVDRIPDPAGAGGSLLGQPLSVDRAVTAWLLGRYRPHPDLAGCASLSDSAPRPGEKVLVALLGHELEALCCEPAPIAAFWGPDHVVQDAAAHHAAAAVKRPLLTVHLPAAIAGGLSPARAVHLALRDARLAGALPYLTGWDACLPEGESNAPLAELLAEMCEFPGPVLVGGQRLWQAAGLERERPMIWIECGAPPYGQRKRLWEYWTGTEDRADALATLAGQFVLTTTQIRDAVATARDLAARRGEAAGLPDLVAAARSHSNPRLVSLAHKIEPRYTWSDIVLPDDQIALLHEIVATVRGRPLVLDEWGVGRKLASSSGVTILFSGPPGTGKTMAAEVMASELGLDLFKIDLSTIVSKYIGETEKNLERIFGEAESSNAILFFDEADAIFGKRSEVKDAHDRYANIEISYLLQRMEAYPGVTILATNLRANLDEAFTRRLQFAVDFPFPDEPYRLRIWQTLLPPGVPREADLDFETLARRFKLAGGNIRNVLVSAAYLAAADGGRLGMRHLLHGTRRELQKMGRLVSDRDLSLLGESNGR